MRTSSILLLCTFGFSLLMAQTNPILSVTSYKLDNGFTVFLNEDSTANKIFGAVMVNAGAKNEYPDATGMAHYLEHLLFKGTESMGTLDYEKEKIHLDSINILYDQLAQTSDESKQAQLQKTINQQAIKASAYGLPNEFDRLLKSIGGTGINAFTNYEMTFYHNSFPAHEIEKWLDLYATRFEKPIFRSFQSELEVVYEEKNRAMDNFGRKIVEKMNAMVFPNLPYGQWSVLGKVEHLKKPSLTKMYDFYERNYVSENMALILTGNFKKEEVKPLIEARFADLRNGKAPTVSLPDLAPVPTNVEKVRMTPVKAEFMAWQTVPQNHPDRIALDVFDYLLSNNAETGLLNQLQLDGKLIFSGAISQQYNNAGGLVIFYVPKLTSSLSKGRKMVDEAIDKIKSGDISDEMFEAAKNEIANNFQQGLEDLTSRGIAIGNAFNQGKSWEEYLDYPEKIRKVSKAEVMQVAQKYIGDQRARMVSRTGFGKTPKLEKPPYKPVVTDQKGSSSYASQEFTGLNSMAFEPRFLDFEGDIDRIKLPGGHELVAVKNPINDLFELSVAFKKGTKHDPELTHVANLLSYVGTEEYNSKEIRQAFASLGCELSIYAGSNSFTLDLSGNIQQLSPALKLLSKVMTESKVDEKSMEIMLNEVQTNRKLEARDPNYMGRALFNYAAMGEEAPGKNRLSVKAMKKANPALWLEKFRDLTSSYEARLVFSGDMEVSKLQEMVNKELPLAKQAKKEAYQTTAYKEPDVTKIYFIHNKKAVQSQVYFHIPGEQFDKEDHNLWRAFNEYFGGGFSGLVLQEIREYRSLAYSAWGAYVLGATEGSKGRYMGFIGCQADKTKEAVGVMLGLLDDMPLKADRMESLRASLQLKTITDFPAFKAIPGQIARYERQGFGEDPYKTSYYEFENLKMEDIQGFYEKYIKGKPKVITVYGDKSRIDVEKLSEYGEVVEVKAEEVANF